MPDDEAERANDNSGVGSRLANPSPCAAVFGVGEATTAGVEPVECWTTWWACWCWWDWWRAFWSWSWCGWCACIEMLDDEEDEPTKGEPRRAGERCCEPALCTELPCRAKGGWACRTNWVRGPVGSSNRT